MKGWYRSELLNDDRAIDRICGLMQLRVKRRGQSWERPGLRGILTVGALVLSERWDTADTAWKVYAASHRSEIRSAA